MRLEILFVLRCCCVIMGEFRLAMTPLHFRRVEATSAGEIPHYVIDGGHTFEANERDSRKLNYRLTAATNKSLLLFLEKAMPWNS